MEIPFSQSNVSNVSIARVNAENTTILNAGGNSSVFAGIVVCNSGTPYEVLEVNSTNLYTKLGAPAHPTEGYCAEPMRHLEEAVTGGKGYVVRVTAADAKFPLLKWSMPTASEPGQPQNPAAEGATEDTSENAAETPIVETPKLKNSGKKTTAGTLLKAGSDTETAGPIPYAINTSALKYGADVSANFSENDVVMLYVIDGNPSTTRNVRFTPDAFNDKRLILTLTETSALGVVTTLDSYTVSLYTDVTDDHGSPAWIETQLESKSRYLRAVAKPNPTGDYADATVRLAADRGATFFVGGTNGDQNNIPAENYGRALKALRNTPAYYSAMLGLGCYSRAVLNELSEIARNRRIDAFFDIDPRLSYAEALEKSDEYNFMDHEHIAFYHFPYTYRDKTSKATTVAGLSGTVFRAKAAGVQKIPSIGGWHYSPAGEERAVISRDNMKCASWAGEPDYDMMYVKRINKVATSRTGVMTIDDSLTAYRRENSLRLQHVNSTMNAIARDLYTLWGSIKHDPDDEVLNNLTRDTPRVFDSYVASKALVPPTEDTAGNTDPYIISYEQNTDDMWTVTYSCCVTGTARRIAGIPILLRKG
ncbi:TPA: hypothetical protein UOR20_003973 [Escherichia coli]|nr:hypothetical protein [Escherichia coli]HEL5853192.1 hypothetical protein [Escherichia coli]